MRCAYKVSETQKIVGPYIRKFVICAYAHNKFLHAQFWNENSKNLAAAYEDKLLLILKLKFLGVYSAFFHHIL